MSWDLVENTGFAGKNCDFNTMGGETRGSKAEELDNFVKTFSMISPGFIILQVQPA